jgi:hypothetical protein
MENFTLDLKKQQFLKGEGKDDRFAQGWRIATARGALRSRQKQNDRYRLRKKIKTITSFEDRCA